MLKLTHEMPQETRVEPRIKVPAMYTLLRVRRAGEERYRWSGHVYDLSRSGMRFELDEALETGAEIEVRAMLPGATHTTVRVAGRVVRMAGDADEPGPVRMAMTFDKFEAPVDEQRLVEYLEGRGLRRAA